MQRTRKIIAGAAAVGAVLGGAGIAGAVSGGGDDGEGTATGPEADAATAAALDATGGGTANAVERDSEKGAVWEVEVTKTDGATVDVRLDADYKLVVIDDDNEATDDETGTG
jgi:predicted regulator of Ras-like GTPase activity (Roadblock/LC7/MglB family)